MLKKHTEIIMIDVGECDISDAEKAELKEDITIAVEKICKKSGFELLGVAIK